MGGIVAMRKIIMLALVMIFVTVPASNVYAADAVTRLEFIKEVFGHVVLNSGTVSVTEFTDVNPFDAPVVVAVVNAGIANGFEDGTFRPHAVVTAEQAIAMVVKFMGQRDYAHSLSQESIPNDWNVLAWSRPYLAWSMEYAPEIAPFFEGGVPASRGLVDLLVGIVGDEMPAGLTQPEPQQYVSVYVPAEMFTRMEFIRELFSHVVMDNGMASVTQFSDVSAFDAPVVIAAVEAGIANGFEDGTFRPYDIVTAEEAIAMVIKFLGLRDEALELMYVLPQGQYIPMWIRPYLAWAMVHEQELLPFFEGGEPASRELVELLRRMIHAADSEITLDIEFHHSMY